MKLKVACAILHQYIAWAILGPYIVMGNPLMKLRLQINIGQ